MLCNLIPLMIQHFYSVVYKIMAVNVTFKQFLLETVWKHTLSLPAIFRAVVRVLALIQVLNLSGQWKADRPAPFIVVLLSTKLTEITANSLVIPGPNGFLIPRGISSFGCCFSSYFEFVQNINLDYFLYSLLNGFNPPILYYK